MDEACPWPGIQTQPSLVQCPSLDLEAGPIQEELVPKIKNKYILHSTYIFSYLRFDRLLGPIIISWVIVKIRPTPAKIETHV